MNIQNLAIMMMVDDSARADIALTPTRTYYRFATDSSIEDGDLNPVADYVGTVASILEAAATEGKPLPAELRLQLFVNSRLQPVSATEESLRAIIELLQPIGAEFAFLNGFI